MTMPENLPEILSDVSRETSEALARYVALLEKWNKAINLVSKGTLADIWSRHIADSAQLLQCLPGGATQWIDLGSGGGLPGLVLAILCREVAPDLRFDLVESDQRKATFLRQVSLELGLPVTVHAVRIERLSGLQGQVVSARALAPLADLCGMAMPLLAPGGIGVFPKGASAPAEIEAAMQHWRFDLERFPSITSENSEILKLSNIRHV